MCSNFMVSSFPSWKEDSQITSLTLSGRHFILCHPDQSHIHKFIHLGLTQMQI